jgi:hypothetical protein
VTGRIVSLLCPTLHRTLYSDLRKHHWPAILGGIDEHLDGEAPVRTIVFAFGELADEIRGVTQRSGDFSGSQGNGLRKRAIPRHDAYSH